MNETTAVCPRAALSPLHTEPLLHRCAARLATAWQRWRERRRLDNELRSLAGLSDATLRDIGLAERVQRPQATWPDLERGRW